MERRSFFKLAGLSAAVLAVGGTLGACEAGKLPDNPLAATNKANETAGQSSVMGQPPIAFDADVDVLIVGSGGSGVVCRHGSARGEALRYGGRET